MGRHRRTTRHVAGWMIGVLLAVQWLVAGYACPVSAQALAPADESSIVDAAAPDCHGTAAAAMDPANPLLCKAHCDGDEQAPGQAAPDGAAAAAPGWCIVAGAGVSGASVAPTGRPAVPRSGAQPPGWPPLYLIHRVLRN